MNQLFADRFKSARLLNGYSLQGLADAMGNKVSKQALHKYEKGEVIPDSEKISLLSDVLNVRPDYFFREMKVELGAIEYRKLKKMPAKEGHKVIEQTRECLSRYLELEEILGIAQEFSNPLKDFPEVSTHDQVDEAATRLRTEWGLGTGPIFNIPELFEDKHIKVVEIDADVSFDGMQTWVNGETIPVIAYNKNIANKLDRIRFTLLHELAHLLLKIDKSLTDGQKERLCHQFAGAVLLPKNTLLVELGQRRSRLSINELGNIKKQYGISMQALVMRANACGIVNSHYTSQFFNLMKQMNWRKEEPIAYEGVERSNRFDQLLYRALAEELISVSKGAALKNMKLSVFRSQSLIM
ncbi:Zn-dependent peptidase ImmA (M78 family) [Anseongella ginsenosidimutans]|uniref:Zn-dependent peptidase ImmA (M78 family) n=1 Tax=Anseongella ginsenosidimutans TaxID=496056 RepID=A0A4R3KSC7_9SPHI|nr:XRE family transcriptional regulator [Anseongella ginsenosidimutans]QEC52817.1 ImmA/IrrE family metallo-endopeptidase [Anseongella ginsenosidimutans]TCS87193.1 Zn-dependent peptidase ImmA (M78 family) [Anseongella ginsenosidimutans]